MPTKRDKWEQVVGQLGLDLSRPLNFVKAADLKRIAQEEPRLMASMDSREAVPSVFADRGLFVLPVSSREYVIVRGVGYHELEETGEPRKFESRMPLEMTALAYGSGETGRILHAFHSGILGDFSSVSRMYHVAGGKSRTPEFQFRVDGSGPISVDGAGMEVDMGFESSESILLLEAKAHRRDNFLIRQLYYPFRSYRERFQKEIRSFFCVAAGGTFSFWEYRWDEPDDYESIRLTKAGSYQLVPEAPPLDEFESIEPDSSFDIVPQADDLGKIAELPTLVAGGLRTPDAWADHHRITHRQANYYTQAASALGLLTASPGEISLSADGAKYVTMQPKDQGDFLTSRILRIPIMNRVFRAVQTSGPRGVGRDEIARLIELSSNLRGSTPHRRAATVLSFFKWMGRRTGAFVVENGRIYGRRGQSRWSALEPIGRAT
jgi:hypothetical protein